MPLNNGLEALSDNLEILPIAETHVDSQLALIMRQQEPVSTLAEKCLPRRRGYLAGGRAADLAACHQNA